MISFSFKGRNPELGHFLAAVDRKLRPKPVKATNGREGRNSFIRTSAAAHRERYKSNDRSVSGEMMDFGDTGLARSIHGRACLPIIMRLCAET